MIHPSPIRRPKARTIPSPEEGYMMVVAMFFLALLVLSLAAAAPQVAKSIQHDRDLETFHRGMQYRRAIQLYYRKFHAYPPTVDALVQSNNIRFLRKKYLDPTTGKSDWKPVLYGQNKTPTAMGFFGQPLSGTTIAGTGPSGGNNSPGGIGTTGSSPNGSIFGPSSSGTSTTTPSADSGSGTSPTDTSGATSGSGVSTGGTGSTGASGTGSGTGSGTSSGLSGQTFGGAGIIGFSPASPKQSILTYKKKNHYNEWEFTYDPISDMQTASGGNTGSIGQPASSTSSPVGSTGLGTSGGTGNGNPSGNAPLNGTTNPGSMPPDMPAPQ